MSCLRHLPLLAVCFAVACAAYAGVGSDNLGDAVAKPAHTKPSLPMAAYLGTYDSEVYGQVRIALDGQSRLRITGGPDQNGALEYWQNDTFRYQHNGGKGSLVQFMVDASHSVSAVQIDETTTFWRIRE